MNNPEESAQEQVRRQFQQLLNERQKLASRITTKEQVAERARDQDVVRAASALTNEGIVKGLADLQLSFDRTVEELSNTLRSEAAKLEQVRRAIEIETGRLNELADTDIAANALDILTQEEQSKLRAFEEWSAQQRAILAQEIADRRAIWQREQEEQQRENAAYEVNLRQERESAEADYAYELGRRQKVEMDKFEIEKRKKEQELVETEEQKKRQWAERKKIIAARTKELETYRAQIDTFPQELERTVQQVRQQATQTGREEAQFEADLFRKEIEANKQLRELRIRTLEETAARQVAQIEALSAELKEALRRAQDLASKAIASEADEDGLPGRPATNEGAG